jgi:hypothetical protein
MYPTAEVILPKELTPAVALFCWSASIEPNAIGRVFLCSKVAYNIIIH